ncbi:MAG: response regulator transcription factor [Porticoccaceae bacterium]
MNEHGDSATRSDEPTAIPAYLVVDDDDAFRDVLSRTLRRRGHRVYTAQDATAAIALCRAHRPARAIVDLKLEHSSGLHLIGQLRALDPHILIVMLTGYSSISTTVDAIKLGATNYLCKPAGIDEIIAAFATTPNSPTLDIASTPPSVNRLEWEHIQRVLKENDGNISATARALGMHRRTLQRKLGKRPVKT